MTICAVSADLRKEEARQDRLERSAPTPEELQRFIDEWMVKECKSHGSEFFIDAFNQVDLVKLAGMFRAYISEDSAEFGYQAFKVIREYHLPRAEEAANSHDFDRDRREAMV